MQLVFDILILLILWRLWYKTGLLSQQDKEFHKFFDREAAARTKEHENLARAFKVRHVQLRQRTHRLERKLHKLNGHPVQIPEDLM